jgi:hypothetical protein
MQVVRASDVTIERITAPDWIIKGLVQRGDVYYWTAPASEMHQLAHVAMTLTARMATNAATDSVVATYGRFGGLEIKTNTRALLVWAKPDHLFVRLYAGVLEHAGLTVAQRVFVPAMCGWLDLRNAQEVSDFIDAARVEASTFPGAALLDLVIINNLNLVNPNSDGTTDMGPIVQAFRTIVHELHCALIVLSVQPPGKNPKLPVAGSSRTSEDAADTASLTVTDDKLTLTFKRSGAVGLFQTDFAFFTTADGNQFVFRVLAEDPDREPQTTKKSRKGAARAAVRERLREQGMSFQPRGPIKLAKIIKHAGIPDRQEAVARSILAEEAEQGEWIIRDKKTKLFTLV